MAITMAPAVYKSHPPVGPYHLPKKDHRHLKARGDRFLTAICYQPFVPYTCTLPKMRTSRRLRGQPPEGQARREVGSAGSREALPRPGFARESLIILKQAATATEEIQSID